MKKILGIALAAVVATAAWADQRYYMTARSGGGTLIRNTTCGAGGKCVRAIPDGGGTTRYAVYSGTPGLWYFLVDGAGFPALMDVYVDTTAADSTDSIKAADNIFMEPGALNTGAITTAHIANGTIVPQDMNLSNQHYAFSTTSTTPSVSINVNQATTSRGVGQYISVNNATDVGQHIKLNANGTGLYIAGSGGGTGISVSDTSGATMTTGISVTGAGTTGLSISGAIAGVAVTQQSGGNGLASGPSYGSSGSGSMAHLSLDNTSGTHHGLNVSAQTSYTGTGWPLSVLGTEGKNALRVTDGAVQIGTTDSNPLDAMTVNMNSTFTREARFDSAMATFATSTPQTQLTLKTSSGTGLAGLNVIQAGSHIGSAVNIDAIGTAPATGLRVSMPTGTADGIKVDASLNSNANTLLYIRGNSGLTDGSQQTVWFNDVDVSFSGSTLKIPSGLSQKAPDPPTGAGWLYMRTSSTGADSLFISYRTGASTFAWGTLATF